MGEGQARQGRNASYAAVSCAPPPLGTCSVAPPPLASPPPLVSVPPLLGYWAVDGEAETAMGGIWRKGPGQELFKAVKDKLGSVPIMAEDLGVITTDVVALRWVQRGLSGVIAIACLCEPPFEGRLTPSPQQGWGSTDSSSFSTPHTHFSISPCLCCCRREAIGAPGMVVLQFAWGGGPSNVHLPHNHYANCFVYPGTHDNETAVSASQRSGLRYFGGRVLCALPEA